MLTRHLIHQPETLQLHETTKLHDAADFAVVDVAHDRLVWRRSIYKSVSPAVRVSVVLVGAAVDVVDVVVVVAVVSAWARWMVTPARRPFPFTLRVCVSITVF